MDKMIAMNEVVELRKRREHYTQLLKSIQIDVNILPDDCLAKLNQYANSKMKLKLFEFDLSYLEDHFYTAELEDIANDDSITKLKKDIKELEEDIDREQADIVDLKKASYEFSTTITNMAEKTEDELKMEQQLLTRKISQFNVPQEINIDDLIAKIEVIQMVKTKKK